MGTNENQSRIAAFFDLDLTITNRDTFRYFLKEEYLSQWRKWPLLVQVCLFGLMRKVRVVSLQTFKERALISLLGKSELYIRETGMKFSEKYLKVTIRPEAVLRLRWHKANGHLVFLATSSPDVYVSSVADYLNCDGYECSRLSFLQNRFLGKFDGNDCEGVEKVRRLQIIAEEFHIDPNKSYAYSDHHSDIPLLEWVGKPVAVCPTLELKRMAEGRGWPIERW